MSPENICPYVRQSFKTEAASGLFKEAAGRSDITERLRQDALSGKRDCAE